MIGRRSEFRYDSLGNRKLSGPTGNTANVDNHYTTNALNQYTLKENNTVRVIGTADAAAKVAVAGGTGPVAAGRKDRVWVADLVPTNTNGLSKGQATVYSALLGLGAGGKDLVKTDLRDYVAPKVEQAFAYDLDGNMTTDSVWNYTYDAENQLIAMEHRADVINTAVNTGMFDPTAAKRMEFTYDYQGRRVSKIVKTGWTLAQGYNSASTVITQTKFIYQGWNAIAEFNGATPTTLGTLLRAYTWGLDLQGSLTATAGVGALVQVYDAGKAKTYLPTYDGNGNVASMVDAAASGLATAIQAAYEYTPFGELLRSEGDYSAVNPIRFSTKYTDLESGLSYYGHRFYSAILGRFINRDPIQEEGGLNLYGFCGNDGVNNWDYLGHWSFKKFFKKVAKFVSPVLSVVGMFFPPLAPLMSAINLGISVLSGVPLGQIVKGFAVGLVAGAIGGKIAGSLVGPTTTQLGSVVTGMVGGAVSSAVGAAVLGGDMRTAVLTGAAMGAISGYAKFKLDHPKLETPVAKPQTNQPLDPGSPSLQAHPIEVEIKQTFSETNTKMPSLLPSSTRGDGMSNGSMTGWAYNSDGSIHPIGELDLSPLGAIIDKNLQLATIRLNAARSMESTAYDWGIAADYWATKGGVRGISASLTVNKGPLRGSVGVGATIDKGMHYTFAGGAVLKWSGLDHQYGLGGSFSQMNGWSPMTHGLSVSSPTVRVGTSFSEALPNDLTIGPRMRFGSAGSATVGLVVNPRNIVQNIQDTGATFKQWWTEL